MRGGGLLVTLNGPCSFRVLLERVLLTRGLEVPYKTLVLDEDSVLMPESLDHDL